LDKQVSIVLSPASGNYRRIAQEWYGLTDEQMIGMDVHHNPPRHKGGRNIPEHLYVYHHTLHSAVHESNFVLWARMGAKAVHAKKNKEGKSAVAVKAMNKVNSYKDEEGKSLNAVKGACKIHENRDSLGRSLHTLRLNEIKNEKGKSVFATKGAEKLNSEKDHLGRSIQGVKNSIRINFEKDNQGRSINAVKGARKMNSQMWSSTIDGFTGNAGNVSQHNKANGWDPAAKVRVL
jgi:hypothetical protein